MRVPVVTRWQSWKRSKAKSLSRFRTDAGGVMSYVALWRKALHKIGGDRFNHTVSLNQIRQWLIKYKLHTHLYPGLYVQLISEVYIHLG